MKHYNMKQARYGNMPCFIGSLGCSCCKLWEAVETRQPPFKDTDVFQRLSTAFNDCIQHNNFAPSLRDVFSEERVERESVLFSGIPSAPKGRQQDRNAQRRQ